METRYPVVFLPGGVLPAEPAYAALLQVLGERVDAVAKDLEVYATERPPADYDLGKEAAGILREADAHRFERFHLVGYSGGGASSLAFTARHGERLLSLGAPRTGMGRQRQDDGGERLVAAIPGARDAAARRVHGGVRSAAARARRGATATS